MYGDDSSKRFWGSRLTPAGLFEEVATTRFTPAAAALGSGAEAPDGSGVADVALHELDVGVARADRLLRCARQNERAHARIGGRRAVLGQVGMALVQEVHEPVSEPAGEPGD